MKKLLSLLGVLGFVFMFGANVSHAAILYTATGVDGNYSGTLLPKATEMFNPLADANGNPITDSHYLDSYSHITFTLSDTSGDTTPVRTLPLGLNSSNFQAWAFSVNRWYDVNALGFGDATGIPLNVVVSLLPQVDLYVFGNQGGSFHPTSTLADVTDPNNPVSLVDLPFTVNIPHTGEPVITLIGSSSVNVPSSSIYEEAGATATDDVDGDLTNSIVVSSGVINRQVGSYPVTYTVTDSNGNTAQAVRTVNVISSNWGSEGSGGGGGSASPVAIREVQGEVLGANTFDFSSLSPAEKQTKISQIHTELKGLISQLIGLLQQQLAAAIASQY